MLHNFYIIFLIKGNIIRKTIPPHYYFQGNLKFFFNAIKNNQHFFSVTILISISQFFYTFVISILTFNIYLDVENNIFNYLTIKLICSR